MRLYLAELEVSASDLFFKLIHMHIGKLSELTGATRKAICHYEATLLRGINVSGQNAIRTSLQSGIVVFSAGQSDEGKLAAAIHMLLQICYCLLTAKVCTHIIPWSNVP